MPYVIYIGAKLQKKNVSRRFSDQLPPNYRTLCPINHKYLAKIQPLMKSIKFLIVIALLVAFNTAVACTNILIIKDTSADGSTMISYCADSLIHFNPL